MYTYTLIIPHKNVPELLQRCLDTIPERDDLNVIIVDDNSDPDIIDFNNFPGKDRANTTIIFDKAGLGAGHARNVGLKAIKDTKWVFFADSDDFFAPYLNTALDKYLDAKADMVFFKYKSVYNDTLEPSNRNHRTLAKIDNAIKKNNLDIIRYKVHIPYCKFISYENVKKNNILYDEVMYSNDVMFALRIGSVSENITIDESVLYVQTERKGSLMGIIKKESIDCRYNVALNAIQFLKSKNRLKYHPNLFSFCYKYNKVSRKLAVNSFFRSLKNTPIQYWIKDLYVCFAAIIGR